MEGYGRMFYGGVDENGNEWAKRFEGVYTSTCGNFWSSQPFTKDIEKKFRRMEWKKRINSLKNKP